jgi:UDP-2-acetamido-2,6-beta-L-arabino-hexul-4-ose reductase
MIRVGITGQAGFVGTHLYNTLGLYPDQFQRIPFEDRFFQEKQLLEDFVGSCDAIVHLAAMNRHNDPEVIYQTNIGLVHQLIAACESTQTTPHILFSSSTQEERDNLYGKSKKEGRELLEDWATRNQAKFTGLIIPNVFGPFGNPYYNSVVATFCHQQTHQETSVIEVDGVIKLIYVAELAEIFVNAAKESGQVNSPNVSNILVPHSREIKVSELLAKIASLREDYFDKGILPDLSNSFDRNLFNTFLCFIDHRTFFPFKLQLNSDDRGSFVETIKLHSGGQVSFSTTRPGVTRGNHFHTRKAERFAVIKGTARIEIRMIGSEEIISFELDGNEPAFVDMPIWFTHNITNIGTDELYTIFWINEHFSASDPDTYFEIV